MTYEDAIAVQDATESTEAAKKLFTRMAASAGKATLAALDLAEQLQSLGPSLQESEEL